MLRRRRLTLVGALVVATALASLLLTSAAVGVRRSTARDSAGSGVVTPLSATMLPGVRWGDAAPSSQACLDSSNGLYECYRPAQIEAAYGLNSLYRHGLNGKGITIALIDAFGSTTIKADLTTFDHSFKLPAPPSFTIIQPEGWVSPLSQQESSGWWGETSLDVEWAHAAAPGASLLLVETPVDETEGDVGMPQIFNALHYVVSHHLAQVVSMSLGVSEPTLTHRQLRSLRTALTYARAHGVTVVAASGDQGVAGYKQDGSHLFDRRIADWPASDPLVTGVGGTTLHLAANGARLSPDSAWNDFVPHGINASGGGESSLFARPSFQTPVKKIVGRHRGVPDVAMSASCLAGVDVYSSHGGWGVECGTSEATPLFAGVVAIADQSAGHSLGWLNPALYALLGTKDNGLRPIESGNNSVQTVNHGRAIDLVGYKAKGRYSLVTGLGSIWAPQFVPALVREAAKLAN